MGMITAIQRFSLHDGPGIRSSVFFKGCNMSCPWCHNPETISSKPQLHVYAEKCVGCGACINVCPVSALALDGEENLLRFDRSKCTACGRCAETCFSGALALSGSDVSVADIMKEISQDSVYYRRSGGGVTLTGGEAMLQPAFAQQLLLACRQAGIQTAMETNLCYDFSLLEPLLPDLDLIMADIKLANETTHLKWAGMSNQQVLDNIQRLEAEGKPFIIRTPVIPGVTDSIENIKEIARFLKPMKQLLYYELLNYNPLGHSKYASLGLEDSFVKARPLPAHQMQTLAQAARHEGLTVKISE